MERGTLCATLFFIRVDGLDQVAASMFISSQVAILASSLRTQVKARRAMHDFTPHQASESLTWAITGLKTVAFHSARRFPLPVSCVGSPQTVDTPVQAPYWR